MTEYAVKRYGTDTSGRPLLMTTYMHDWWTAVTADLGFVPTIVQGAFMARAGGGARASAGYHDQGGCLDVRTWDLTVTQVDHLVRTCRRHGAAAWRRDKTPQHGGMDPHCHITLGTDRPLSAGAKASWRSYLDGRNGLANNRADYEWRPAPLITTPPEDDMPSADEIAKAVWQHKLTNRNRDGQPTGEMQAGSFLSNIEWNNDRDLHEIRDQLAAISKRLDALEKK